MRIKKDEKSDEKLNKLEGNQVDEDVKKVEKK